jgi:hypothetical protein
LASTTLSGNRTINLPDKDGTVALLDDITIFTGLTGENYILVGSGGTASENGTRLLNAYAYAKTLTPNGSSLSATNRMTIGVMAGYYVLSSDLILDYEFIDIVSLTNESDIFLSNKDFKINANNIKVIGVNVGTAQFYIEDQYPNNVYINCVGGEDSFGGGATVTGRFTNCVGGDNSFGGNGGSAIGIFTNCEGGLYSFGGDLGTASGTFTNCVGGDYSFGGKGGTASGTFNNCIGGQNSFGGSSGTVSGAFNNCIGGDISFGGSSGTVSGTFTNCVGGDTSFGGTVSGTFNNCIGGDGSFLDNSSFITGQLYYCRISGTTSFQPVSTGIIRFCVNGDGSVVGAGNFLSISGGTVTGLTNFTNGLSANTISATTFYGDASNLTGVLSKTNLSTTLTVSSTTKTVPLNTFYLYDKITLSAITSAETVTAITSNASISAYTPSIKFFAQTGITITFRNSTTLKTEGGLDAVIVGSNYDSITFTYNNDIRRYFQTNINNYI